VLFDDMLPRSVDEAARDRHTSFWAGDVYKVLLTLRAYRPDLVLLPVNTEPTGVLLVLATDPSNKTLGDRYDEIERQYVVADPQDVPAEILTRSCAFDPEEVLAAPFWDVIISGREPGRRTHSNVKALIDSVRVTFPAA
jgi:hypothetical protein